MKKIFLIITLLNLSFNFVLSQNIADKNSTLNINAGINFFELDYLIDGPDENYMIGEGNHLLPSIALDYKHKFKKNNFGLDSYISVSHKNTISTPKYWTYSETYNYSYGIGLSYFFLNQKKIQISTTIGTTLTFCKKYEQTVGEIPYQTATVDTIFKFSQGRYYTYRNLSFYGQLNVNYNFKNNTFIGLSAFYIKPIFKYRNFPVNLNLINTFVTFGVKF